MDKSDPTLYLAEKVGELSGVINTFQSAITGKLDDMQRTIDTRITRPECEVIVSHAIDEHNDKYHDKKTSIAPGVSVKINAAMLKKIGLIVGGTAIGSSGIWAIIKQVLDSVQ